MSDIKAAKKTKTNAKANRYTERKLRVLIYAACVLSHQHWPRGAALHPRAHGCGALSPIPATHPLTYTAEDDSDPEFNPRAYVHEPKKRGRAPAGAARKRAPGDDAARAKQPRSSVCRVCGLRWC
jgi:hypothetical protein